MKFLKFLLIALGFYVLYLSVRGVGIDVIWRNVCALRWSLLPLPFFYAAIYFWNTLGWKYSFANELPPHVPFRGLYAIRIIGETLNTAIPFSASLGGEAVKTELLKRRYNVPLAEGLASILIVHTTLWASLNIFVIGGVLWSFDALTLAPALRNSVWAFLALLGISGGLLFAGLQWGLFKQIHAFGEKWKWWGSLSADKAKRFFELDEQIRRFYTSNPRRFLLSTLYNLLGWLTGALETWFLCRILQLPAGFPEAWLFEVLIQVLRIVTFFIPASIGAQEGGIMLIFSQFGYAGPAGITFAVVRRLRELVWIGLGLLLWSFAGDKPKARA